MIVKAVGRYNAAARSAGVAILRHSDEYQFMDQAQLVPAYKHRPVNGRVSLPSLSHCGVEFIRAMDSIAEAKFAGAMTKERFLLVK